MSGAVGGYYASAAFVLVLFILLVIILRAGYWVRWSLPNWRRLRQRS